MTIIDFKLAQEVYMEKTGKEITRKKFLKKVGVSSQTAWNLQNGKNKQDILGAALKLSELTGLKLDEIIKSVK